MKKYLILLLLISCETEEPNYCFKMIRISDALPIQFWLNGQPSFNQKEEDGVDHVCFYQPFNTEDEIKTQFISDENIPHVLSISQDDLVINEIEFSKEGSAPNVVNSLEFIPEDLSITGLIKLAIKAAIDFSLFDSDLDGYANSGSGSTWAYSSENGGSAKLSTSTSGRDLLKSIVVNPNVNYKIKINTVQSGGFGSITIVFSNSGATVHTITGIANGANEFTLAGSVIASCNEIRIAPVLLGGTRTYWVQDISVIEDFEIYHSDLIDIQSLHAKTLLIKYSNPTDYAGLVYEGLAAVPEFGIRVKAKFYEPRFPEENESEADGEGNVDKLSSTTKTQRLLEIDPLPPYEHKKLKLALQHNTIYIQNLAWVKEEAYEIEKIAEKYPFFKAKAWLTLQSNEFILNA